MEVSMLDETFMKRSGMSKPACLNPKSQISNSKKKPNLKSENIPSEPAEPKRSILRNVRYLGLVFGFWTLGFCPLIAASPQPQIVALAPPDHGFFTKQLDFHGIPIKAPRVVVDAALFAAYDRLSMLLSNQPNVISNLAAAGAELHIIGRDQVTTDLPEWRHDKGVKLREYNGLTRDERTRGMGGLLTSCGEENLLKLENDRYRGRDICLHEFAHCIRNYGVPREMRTRFDEQFRRSLAADLWRDSYAGSNPDEFFAE